MSRVLQRQRSTTESIRAFLAKKGPAGATLREIYDAVHTDIGQQVRNSSIRAVLYKRLVTAETAYRPLFERAGRTRNSRYRLATGSSVRSGTAR